MKKNHKLEKEELELAFDIESGNWNEVTSLEASKKQMIKNALHTQNETQEINIQIKSSDLHDLKVKSIETGIPYKQLITTLLQQYTKGNFKIKL